MARVRLSTSAALASCWRAATSMRGVITDSAVRSPRPRVRTNRVADSSSIAPARAECRASEPSSAGVRAWPNSSCGSMPNARTVRSAEPFRKLISGRQACENAVCGATTERATWSGREIAQFFGTSSPITICTTVASSMPTITAMPRAAPSGRPRAVNTGFSRTESAGSASMPTTSEVTVMPSWAPESSKERCRRARETRPDLASPAAAGVPPRRARRSRRRTRRPRTGRWRG